MNVFFFFFLKMIILFKLGAAEAITDIKVDSLGKDASGNALPAVILIFFFLYI